MRKGKHHDVVKRPFAENSERRMRQSLLVGGMVELEAHRLDAWLRSVQTHRIVRI